MMNEDYADVVEALHDAALAMEADVDYKINALINVAVEAALSVYGPKRGPRLLRDILSRHLKDASAQGVGEPGYYEERH
jgi:hypothetical protein